MGDVQKYLNPLTLEAKLFTQALQSLSQTCNALDVHLLEALENVITSIEKFIDENNKNEIVETNKTQLVKCDSINHIQRIYHCSYCKRDLGKTTTQVALHMAEVCAGKLGPRYTEDAGAVAAAAKEGPEATQKPEKDNITKKKPRFKNKEEKKKVNAKKVLRINKKTVSFLTMDLPNLNTFLKDFAQVGEKLKSLQEYRLIEDNIRSILQPIYPQKKIKMYQFGSRMTGIGTRESDLDIFIDIDETFHKFETSPSAESKACLLKLRDVMRNNHKTWKGMIFIESARVPIIKIIHTKTGIECDINVTNSLGHINTQFLEYLFTLQPLTKYLCIYMKKWINRTNQKDEFRTYSITLMVIFYMQQINLLPPISKFFEVVDKDSAVTIGPWISSFARLTLKDLNIAKAEITNMFQHIIGFFHYYLKFDFNKNVVCPFAGKEIKIDDLNSVMPERYISFIAEDKKAEIVIKKAIVVQDPIQLNNNVTKNINEYELDIFKQYISRSLEILKDVNTNI